MRNRFFLIGDLILIVLVAFGAFALRFDLRFYHNRPEFFFYLALAVTIKPITFFVFGLYQRWWRYASVADLVAVAAAVLASSIVMAVAVAIALWLRPTLEISRAVLLIDALLTLVCVGAFRMSVRVIAEGRAPARSVVQPSSARRILVVGAGAAGVMVVRELRRNRQLEMVPIGFLDDDPVKFGKRIHGVAVLGSLDALASVTRDHEPDEVLIAMPTAPGATVRALADRCRELALSSRIIPGVFELLGGTVSVNRLRQIDITDLLRRAPVSGEVDASRYLADRVVLVTGAGGSIGFELCRQVAAAHPARLILLGHGENSLFDARIALLDSFPNLPMDVILADVRDRARMMAVFEQHRPEIVFHAAAHKHVPLMEENPEEAISNNVLGTRNVVDAAMAVQVTRLVMISTDKAVAPSNIMGASKRVAESIVRSAALRDHAPFVVVRFGNVLGSRGSVVPFFKRQIERGGPVTITHPDMRRFFMTIPEAVHLVVQAGGIGRGGELFVLDMGAPVRIVDLARDMIALSGFQPDDIPIVFTGVRAGEKLHEALWEDGAVVEPTACPSVLQVTEPELWPVPELPHVLDSVTRAAASGGRIDIEAELARWVHSYVPAGTPTS